MKQTLLFVFLLLFSAKSSRSQTTRWAIDIGDSSDITIPYSICTDSRNNDLYVAGLYRTNLTMCSGALPTVLQLTLPQENCNMILSKFDSSGNCVWTIPGIAISNLPPGVPGINSIKYNGRGYLYIAGGFTDTMVYGTDTVKSPTCQLGDCNVAYIMKLDTSGHVSWAKSFGGSQNTSPQINYMVVADDKVFVTGTYQDSISMDGHVLAGPNAYSIQPFIAEINPNGVCVWLKSIGSGGYLTAMQAIATDGTGLYVSGLFSDSLVLPTGTIYETASYASVLLKFDTSGAFKWVFGGTAQMDRYYSIANIKYDGAGHIYWEGDFFDSIRFNSTTLHVPGYASNVVARFDTAGHFEWAYTPGLKISSQAGTVLSADKTGFYLISAFKDTATFGSSTYISNGLGDIVLARYDTNRTVVWSKSFGGTREENPTDLISNNGVIFYSGETFSNYSIDGFPIVNHNYGDMLLARVYDPTSVDTSGSTLGAGTVTLPATTIYPNPTTGKIYIRSNVASETLQVVSLTGQLLLVQSRTNTTATVDLSSLPSGIYLLKDISAAGVETFKVIKE